MVAMSVRALNASSLLLAYQAELQDEMSASPAPALWDEVCVVTDLCLRLQRCAVQASGRAMALMVVQERARWLNLSSLSQKEKAQLLDVPVDPKGLFGPAVATMQRLCEENKKEGEALQLCLPRKMPPPPPPAATRQMFAQAVTRPGYRIPKHQPQAQAATQSKPPELKGAWAKKPFAANVTQGNQAAPPATYGDKKKQRATSDDCFAPDDRCSVRAMFREGMFRTPQEACRGHAGTRSSQPEEEEEGRTRRRLCGAPAVSQKQTPVSLPLETCNKNVFWCTTRLKAKGAVISVNKHRKETEHGCTAQNNTTGGRHNPTCGAADRSASWTAQSKCRGCTTRCPAQRSSKTGVRSASKAGSTVACMHSVELGVENCNQRLQAPVRVNPAQIQHGFAIEGAEGKSLYSAGGNQLAADQGSYPNSTARRETERFLFEVFSGPEERRGSATHIRSACSEQIHEKVQVQDADAHSSDKICASRRLVHIHRPEGRILSHPYLSPAQKISPICLPGHNI